MVCIAIRGWITQNPSVKTFIHSALAATSLLATLTAGEVPATGISSESECDTQSLFGAPHLRFASNKSDTELPGFRLGAATYTHRFSADFDNLPGDVSSDRFDLWAPVLPLNFGDMHVIASLGYEATRYDTSAVTLLPEDTLHRVNMPVVFLHDISEEWIWGAMVMPTYAGNTGGDAFTYSAALGAGYQWNPNLEVFGGVYYAENFGEEVFVPGIGFVWRPAPRWKVSVLPPMGAISYSLSDKWLLSLYGQYRSPSWNSKADAAGPQRLVNMSSFSLGLKAEYNLGGAFWASLGAGWSMGQNLTVDNTSNNKLVDDDIDASPFVQAGLNLRF